MCLYFSGKYGEVELLGHVIKWMMGEQPFFVWIIDILSVRIVNIFRETLQMVSFAYSLCAYVCLQPFKNVKTILA